MFRALWANDEPGHFPDTENKNTVNSFGKQLQKPAINISGWQEEHFDDERAPCLRLGCSWWTGQPRRYIQRIQVVHTHLMFAVCTVRANSTRVTLFTAVPAHCIQVRPAGTLPPRAPGKPGSPLLRPRPCLKRRDVPDSSCLSGKARKGMNW